MNTIIALFAAGVVFLALELIVPGVAMGIVGACCFIAGCFFCFGRYGPWVGAVAVLGAVGLGMATIYFEFYVLPRTRAGRKLFLGSSVGGTSQPPPAQETIVGKTGEAITTLAPSGYVVVDGKKYEAFSQDGWVSKGTPLKVVAVDHLTLRVAKS